MEKFEKLTREEMKKVNGAGGGDLCTPGVFCNILDNGLFHPGHCDALCVCHSDDGEVIARICTT